MCASVQIDDEAVATSVFQNPGCAVWTVSVVYDFTARGGAEVSSYQLMSAPCLNGPSPKQATTLLYVCRVPT